MNWIVHLHPEFAEEVRALSPSLRLQLFIILLQQQAKGPYAVALDAADEAEFALALSYSTQFYKLGPFVVSFDAKALRRGVSCLHLGAGEAGGIIATTAARLDDILASRVEGIPLDDLLDRDFACERQEALSVIARAEMRLFRIAQIGLALTEAGAEAAEMFNYSPKQMARFCARMDHYFAILNRRCENHDLRFYLGFNSPGQNVIETESFDEVTRMK